MSRAKKPSENELIGKITELEEDLKRVQADLFNVRRRAENDRLQIGDFAKIEMIKNLLPAIDNISLAISKVPAELENSDYIVGLKSVLRQLQKALSDNKINKLEILNQEFDPAIMEAVAVNGDGNKEVVSEVLQNGYTLNDQLIRPAVVKVDRVN